MWDICILGDTIQWTNAGQIGNRGQVSVWNKYVFPLR